jgi:hypothetical protein
METLLRLMLLLMLLLSVSSCVGLPFPTPDTEICVYFSQVDGLRCDDKRLEGTDQASRYTRAIESTDVCTNLQDYKTLEEYVLFLRQEIQRLKIEGK